MEYNVLWIDDLCNDPTGRDFIGYAEQEDINITAFESHEEGITHLMDNLDNYHAVILDAKVKEKQGDTKLGLAGLRASRDKLIQLNEEIYLPWFIFTGQPDYQKSDDFRDSYGDFYIKGEDNEKLILDTKDRIENKTEYIIQKKYSDAFEVCSDAYHMTSAGKRVMEILKIVESSKANQSTKDLFTPIRKVIEILFGAFNKFELIPDDVYNGQGWINKSCAFLSGKHHDYQLKSDILPPAISSSIWNSLNIIQDASHADQKLRLKIDEHVQMLNTNYLYNSIVYQLLDVLVWFKKYIDSNPEKNNWTCLNEQNESEDSEKQVVIGTIQKDSSGNYYCGDYALNNRYTSENYNVGDEIEIVESSNNTNFRTKGFYPKYANKFKKIIG